MLFYSYIFICVCVHITFRNFFIITLFSDLSIILPLFTLVAPLFSFIKQSNDEKIVKSNMHTYTDKDVRMKQHDFFFFFF